MSLAYDILYSQKCRSTHHKLAMDALRQLRIPDRQRWEDLFLYYVDWYLEGAKAPDDKFKDFRNHVLHVRENFWGGACKLAFDWYGKTVDMLRRRDWPAAVYSAGVMSHYFTDPFMPFHTGQTESEGNVHRAVEWSICKSYDSLRRLIEARGYPAFEPTNDPDDWLAEMIRRGAVAGNQHYEVCIDHYNLDLGSRNPPAGLDDEMRDRISEQLGLATVGLARVLERAFVDAAATPDSVPVAITLALSTANTPVQAVKDFVNDRADRIQVAEIYAEFKVTGKVVNTLPADDRAVRKAHAAEVLQVPLFLLDAEKTRPPGQKHGTFEPLQPKTTVAGLPTRRKYDIHGNPLGEDNQPVAVRRYDAPVTAVPASSSVGRGHSRDEACRCPNCAGTGSTRPTRSPALVGARSVSVGSGSAAVGGLGYSTVARPPAFGTSETTANTGGSGAASGGGFSSGGSGGGFSSGSSAGNSMGDASRSLVAPEPSRRGNSVPQELGPRTNSELVTAPAPKPSTPPVLTPTGSSFVSLGDALDLGTRPRAEIDETTKTSSPPAKPDRDPLTDRSGRPRTEDSTIVRTGPNRLTALPRQGDGDHRNGSSGTQRDTTTGEGSRSGSTSSPTSGNDRDGSRGSTSRSPTGQNTGEGERSDGRESGTSSRSSDSGKSGSNPVNRAAINSLLGPLPTTGGSPASINSRVTSSSNGTDDNNASAGRDRQRDERSSDAPRTEREDADARKREDRARSERESRNDRSHKFYLDLDDDLEKAPTIGNKTAHRFANIGVKTVRDFLNMEASAIAAKLNQKGMNAQLLREWQDQARLAAAIPNIRGHDAQIMVGCGLRQPQEVAAASVDDLQAFVQEYVATSEGQRVLRGGQMPDREEITQWISWAKDARSMGI